MKPQIDTQVRAKLDELLTIVAADPPTDTQSQSYSFTITRDRGGVTYAQTVSDEIGNSTNISERVVAPAATTTDTTVSTANNGNKPANPATPAGK
jgi:hypothetical protein